MDDLFDPFFEGNDTKTLVNRYEKMQAHGELLFFDVEEFEDLLDYYIAERNNKKAFEVLEMARSQHPFTNDFTLREAELLSSVGREKEALEKIESIEVFESYNIDLQMSKANILSQMGNIQGAIKTLQSALDHADREEQNELLLSIAFEYQALAEYDKAIHFLTEVLDREPDNDDALYELAFCLEQSEKDTDAIQLFERYIDENPYSHHAWFNLGNTHFKLGDHDAAIKAFDFAIVIREDFASAYFSKAMALMREERYKEAIEELKVSLNYELIDSVTYYYIGECYEKLEDPLHAFNNYRKAVGKDPQMVTAWLGMANVAAHEDRHHESVTYVKKALSIDAKNGMVWMSAAEVYKTIGSYDAAIEAYDKALSFGFDDLEVYLNYSEILFDEEHIDEANEVIESGIEKHPEQCEIYYRFAAYLLKNGQEEDAIDYLALALELSPADAQHLTGYYPAALHYPAVLDLLEKYNNQ